MLYVKGQKLASVWMILLVSILSGCALQAPTKKSTLVKSCKVPSDQQNAFQSKWSTFPIPITISGFSDGEKAVVAAQVQAAVDLWNDHFIKVRGFAIFDFDPTYLAPNRGIVNDFCADPSRSLIKSATEFRYPVVIYRSNATIGSGVIASTSTCLPSSSPPEDWLLLKFAPGLGYGWIDLNFAEFFTNSKFPDLKSIVAHELGHLLGLGHTCESDGKRYAGKGGAYALDVPVCGAIPEGHVYREALMFPTFKFDSDGRGEERFSANKNDQGRANCLVDP